MTENELGVIRNRAERATPGPWFPSLTDDDMCMNACYVTTKPSAFEHDNRLGMTPNSGNHDAVVCITLLQHPRLACHKAQLWDEDADFIAHAREDVPALLKTVSDLQRHNEELNCLTGLQDMQIEKLESLLAMITKHPNLLNLKVPCFNGQTLAEIIQSGDLDALTSAVHLIENGGGE